MEELMHLVVLGVGLLITLAIAHTGLVGGRSVSDIEARIARRREEITAWQTIADYERQRKEQDKE